MSKFIGIGDAMGGGGVADDTAGVIVLDEVPEGDIIEDGDGGGVIVEEEDELEEIPDDLPFDANLAKYISEDKLGALGADLIEKITQDFDSNSQWREDFQHGLRLLGFKAEDRDWLFKGAAGNWDTKMLEAWIRLHSEIFSELWPSGGPVKTEILGEETQELRDQAKRTRQFANYYLRRVAREYYDDSEVLLNYAILAGSAFRKAYVCPVLGRPVLKYISPDKCAMPYSANSIWDTPRFTHINDEVTDYDLRIMQMNGYYRDVEIKRGAVSSIDITNPAVDEINGTTDNLQQNDEPYVIYEILLDYDLHGFEHKDDAGELTGLPLPYKMTVASDGTVLRIERNWDPIETESTGLYTRKLNITQYCFMRLFGPFGVGLLHCLGGSAETRTKIKRMLQDAGAFANFPPTARVKGMRLEENTQSSAPGQNFEIDTGGLPIDQAIKQMAVKEPSPMLKALFDDEGMSSDRLIGTTEIAVGDGRQDAPVGTTMALLAAAKKPQTGVMKRMHRALSYELEMLFELFAKWLPAAPYPYLVAGSAQAVMSQDFNSKINPMPVSDPNMMSEAQRMMRSETLLRVVTQLPPNAAPYQIEAARMMLVEMGVDGVDKYLPPMPQQAQPKDPVTENMDASLGRALKAFIEQNHDAHIAVHTPMAQNNPALQAHIAEHQAMKYRLAIENTLGFALPPEGAPIDPAVQERIAMMAAQATEEYMQKLAAQQPPAPPSVEQIMIMDVEQKKEKEMLRHQQKMAELEQELQIADIQSDDKAAERAARLQIARMQTSADLIIEEEKAKSKGAPREPE